MMQTSPSVAPFMKLSKAYQNGDKVLVRVEGGIAAIMLDTPEIKQALSELSAVLSDVPVPANSFEFQEVAKNEEITPLDELASNKFD